MIFKWLLDHTFSILSFLSAAFAARQVMTVRVVIDGRMNELLALTAKASKAEGAKSEGEKRDAVDSETPQQSLTLR
jgi:hypothetical protein